MDALKFFEVINKLKLLTDFPFIKSQHALVILRISLAVFFMAHALVRIFAFTIPSFAYYLNAKGWPFSLAIVWMITIYEITAGTLMIFGKWVRWCAAGLFFIAGMGIVIIHAQLGWFVGEHGTGGMEYSLCLMVSLLAVAAFDAEKAGNREYASAKKSAINSALP
jgi:putative oxidoreductase